MDSGGQPGEAGNSRDGSQPSAAGYASGGVGGRAMPTAGSTAGRSGGSDAGDAGAEPIDAGGMDASQQDASAGFDASTGSDASVADAGSGDAGTDSGSSSGGVTDVCAGRSDLLYCNAFDKDPYDGIEYQIVYNGDAVLSTTIKYSGVGSMRASTRSAKRASSARFATRKLNKQKSGEFWSRYYYYLPSSTQITTFFSSGVASEVADPFSGFHLQVYSDHVRIESMIGNSSNGPAFTRDRWVCVELHAVVHSSNGYFEAYLDGTRAVRIGPGNTVPATGYTAAEFGIHYADENQGPVVVYVDEAMVDTARVPCN